MEIGLGHRCTQPPARTAERPDRAAGLRLGLPLSALVHALALAAVAAAGRLQTAAPDGRLQVTVELTALASIAASAPPRPLDTPVGASDMPAPAVVAPGPVDGPEKPGIAAAEPSMELLSSPPVVTIEPARAEPAPAAAEPVQPAVPAAPRPRTRPATAPRPPAVALAPRPAAKSGPVRASAPDVPAAPAPQAAAAPSPGPATDQPPVATDRTAALILPVPPRPVGAGAGNRPPDYPGEARRRGWQGRVLVRVAVSPQGSAVEVSLAASSGHALLDEAALRAVRGWRFVPATRDGVAEAGLADVPVQFILDD